VDDSSISVTGLDGAPITSVQIFTSDWSAQIFNCFADCGNSVSTPAIPGTYNIYVKFYDASYRLICEKNEQVTITNGGSNCDNITNGGIIGANQTICPDEMPTALTNISLPTGGTGQIEYIWLSSTTGCPSSINDAIPGATGPNYSPSQLTQTTYFRRCARRAGCTTFSVGESNCIKIIVEDSDGDGVCDSEDCAPLNPTVPGTPGASCDDGDANTNNDVITADGCGCTGQPNSSDPCSDVSIAVNGNNVIISGLNAAPITSAQIFNASWSTEFSCFANCGSSVSETVSSGSYHVYVKFYNSSYGLICEEYQQITVTSGGGDNTCDNVTNGGIIGQNQTICPGDMAAPLTNVNVPTGGTGQLEYIWLSSTTGCPTNLNQAISGASQANYSPGSLTQTTHFVRCARRTGCTSWTVGESNCVTVTVDNSDCGGGNGIDLAIDIIGDGLEVGSYQNFTVDLIVTNEGTQTATNVVINIPQPQNVVFQGSNPFDATQGNYNYSSTYNWSVGTLASGQMETITLNYFSLAGNDFTVYGQVMTMTGTDIDSTPANGTPPTVNEDDEAAYTTGVGGGNSSCMLDLVANTSNVVCNDNGTPANQNDDTFTFDLVVTGGNPWGWQMGGTSSNAYGQTVNVGPYNINSGAANIIVTDADNATCSINVSVNAPATCSAGTGESNDCNNISITHNSSSITIGGLDNAPLTAVWIFDANWNTVFNCSYDCGVTETVNVTAGLHRITVKKMNLDWSVICKVEEEVNISAFNGGNGTVYNIGSIGDDTTNAVKAPQADVKIYPNPSTGFVNFKAANNFNKTATTLELIDNTGRTVQREELQSVDISAYSLDLTAKGKGIYFLKITFEDGTFVFKRVVLVE